MPRRLLSLMIAILLTAGAGCGLPDPVPVTEAPLLHDDLTAVDIQTLLEAVELLPQKKISALPELFPPPPNWSSDRNVPVSELVDEEQLKLDERWDWRPLYRALPRNRQFDRFLRRHKMSRERLAGVILMTAAALSKSTLHDDQNLNDIVIRGRRAVMELRSNKRPFHTLPPESLYDVLHQAIWITRLERARLLADIPDGNVAVVMKQRDRLAALFPPSVMENPFDNIVDRLEEQGVPFSDLPDSEFFDIRDWDRSQAIIGRPPRAAIPSKGLWQ